MSESLAAAKESDIVVRAPFPKWPVAVAALLAVGCALCLPAYSGPDELAHVAYVSALAKGHLPVIPAGELADVATGTTWQGQHPPLFYLFAVPLYLLAGRHLIVSLYLFRLLSSAGLIATVILVNRVAISLLPRKSAEHLATWIVAVHPTVVYVSSMVNNEAWAMALSVACVYAALNAARAPSGDPKRERFWLIASAALGGLALLTKLTAIAGVAAAVTILLQRPEQPSEARPAARGTTLRGLAVLAGALALWLPWGLLMHRLHGAFVPSPVQRPVFNAGPIAVTLYPLEAANFSFIAAAEFAIGFLTPYWLMTPFPWTHNLMLAMGTLVTIGTLWCSAAQRCSRFAGVAFVALLFVVVNHILFRDALAIIFLARYSPIAAALASMPVAAAIGRLPQKPRVAAMAALGLVAAAGYGYVVYFYTIGPAAGTKWHA